MSSVERSCLGAVEEEQLPASRFGSFGIGGIK